MLRDILMFDRNRLGIERQAGYGKANTRYWAVWQPEAIDKQ